MKRIILILFLILSFTSYAQNAEPEVYCSIEMPSAFYGPKNGFPISVDYGDATSNKNRENIKDKDGKELRFFSTMQVVNYMSKEGWGLFTVSPTRPKESSFLSPSEYSQSLFVFKRKSNRDE
jgi:hypothetical protein